LFIVYCFLRLLFMVYSLWKTVVRDKGQGTKDKVEVRVLNAVPHSTFHLPRAAGAT